MKPLKPSHRENKRYLLIKGKDASRKNIEEVILEFIGVLGFAEASPQVVYLSSEKIVLAVNRSAVEKVRTAFLMSGKDIRVEKISGSLGKVK